MFLTPGRESRGMALNEINSGHCEGSDDFDLLSGTEDGMKDD